MANPIDIRLGPDARVKVNNLTFAVVDSEATAQADKAKTTDSESIGQDGRVYEIVKGGITRMNASFTGQRDSALNIHTVYGVYDSAYIDLKIYPDGLGGTPIHIPSFFVESWKLGQMHVEGSPVQIIQVSGQSSGAFYRQDQPF